MKKASLVEARNNLSEVVDDAEHRGESTVILRHGKPSAVVVPLAVGMPLKAKRRPMTDERWEALRAEFAAQDDPTFSAVLDIREGRDKR